MRWCMSGNDSGIEILLQKELAERPDDPFIYYYLGTLAFERSGGRKRWDISS